MPRKPDDWPKHRSRGTPFTASEINRIRNAFINRERIEDVARELGASSRNISKHYGLFRAEGVEQHRGR